MPKKKSHSSSPSHTSCCNVYTELDNKMLKNKNYALTQNMAKLQQERAELQKRVTLLEEESFELNSRYNNLKNVVSVIDSTSKACLQKLTEVVNIFPGIIQLCSVASNISNMNKDTRTHAVKPHIVNGHVLQNPTITLSRLEGSNASNTPHRPRTSNVIVRPSTSQSPDDNSEQYVDNDERNEDESDIDNDTNGVIEEHNRSIRSMVNRGLYNRQVYNNRPELQDDDESETSSEELETSMQEESVEGKLSIIHEMDEEEMDSVCSSRSKPKRSFKGGKFQEVQIYLNQLPNAYVEQIKGGGNISISVTPPDKRPSFNSRRSSMIAEADDSLMESQSGLTVSFNCASPSDREAKGMQHSHEKAIKTDETPSTSRYSDDSSSSSEKKYMYSIGTPKSVRGGNSSRSCNSLARNQSPNTSTHDFSAIMKNNITKRKSSKDKEKYAQVLLNRLSLERKVRFSNSFMVDSDVVNMPPLKSPEEIRRTSKMEQSENEFESPQRNSSKNSRDDAKVEKRTKRSKDESPRKSRSSGKFSPGRPKRKGRPKSMKEPSLRKKMRRSK